MQTTVNWQSTRHRTAKTAAPIPLTANRSTDVAGGTPEVLMATSLQQSRLGINMVLSNLAQGVIQPEFAMRLLYLLVEVADYGGQIIEFDDSAYLEVDDDRGDDTPYLEIQESYFGRPFTLNTKGLSYRVGDKKANQMQRLRINWGQRASQRLMGQAGLMHEIEAATAATTVGNYANTNRITLSTGSQFNEADVDPFGVASLLLLLRLGLTLT